MYQGYDRTADVMSITDADIAADWRKGMLRSVADLITTRGQAEGVQSGGWGAISFKEGELAHHFHGSAKAHTYTAPLGTGACKIVKVTDLTEDSDTQYHHDTFGSGEGYRVTILSAKVTCEHSVTGRMSLTESVGELIYAVASV